MGLLKFLSGFAPNNQNDFGGGAYNDVGSALQALAQQDTAFRDDQHMGRIFAANPAFGRALYGQKNAMAENDIRQQMALTQLQELTTKKNQQKIAGELINRFQSGDKTALTQLAAINPQAAETIAKLNSGVEYKVQDVGGQLVRYNPNDPNAKPEVIFTGNQQTKPLSQEAQLTADFKAGLIDKDTYERAMAKKIAPTEKNYKQFQLQNAAFADRMQNAGSLVGEVTGKEGFEPISKASSFFKGVPSFGLGEVIGNAILSEDQQKFKNAAQEWIRAKLRKESGAAIGVKEMEDEYATYFPVVGDKPEVIKQKEQLRKVATESMIKQSQGAYEDEYGNPIQSTEAASPSQKIQEGTTATNPKTGEKRIFKNGVWQKL